jgi:hypothetical protein
MVQAETGNSYAAMKNEQTLRALAATLNRSHIIVCTTTFNHLHKKRTARIRSTPVQQGISHGADVEGQLAFRTRAIENGIGLIEVLHRHAVRRIGNTQL